MQEEITTVEGLKPYLGKVVKVWWVPRWGWLFHRLGTEFEQLTGPGYEGYGVRSVMQVHNDVGGDDLGLTRDHFKRGMKVLPCSSEAEYANVVFTR